MVFKNLNKDYISYLRCYCINYFTIKTEINNLYSVFTPSHAINRRNNYNRTIDAMCSKHFVN